MSLISMTGFARSDGAHANVRWHWEVRCVNGKSMDVRCRLPYGYERLEPDIRKLLARYISRGNAQVSLSLKDESGPGELIINETALTAVTKAAARLVEDGVAAAPTADGLLALKGILELSVPAENDADVKTRNDEILNSLEAALNDLVAMRQREGEHLSKVLAAHLAGIEKLLAQIRDQAADTVEVMRARARQQVARVIESSQSLDEDRLYQEAVILASKADITEELDRLDAHIISARAYMNTGRPIGRKLEFLAQEFNREVNTICSKSPVKEITASGLDMKAVIDQIREQVLNIE